MLITLKHLKDNELHKNIDEKIQKIKDFLNALPS